MYDNGLNISMQSFRIPPASRQRVVRRMNYIIVHFLTSAHYYSTIVAELFTVHPTAQSITEFHNAFLKRGSLEVPLPLRRAQTSRNHLLTDRAEFPIFPGCSFHLYHEPDKLTPRDRVGGSNSARSYQSQIDNRFRYTTCAVPLRDRAAPVVESQAAGW